MEAKDIVRVRIAPSPTGFPHIGTIYQALFDYVFAKKFNGKFYVRLEDTDRGRFVEGSEEVIYSSLEWFGLSPDESPVKGGEYGPYRQSERLDIYKKYIDQLVESGHAYHCFCTKERLEQMRAEQEKNHQAPMYDRTCRNLTEQEVEEKLKSNTPFVIRMKIPDDRKISFQDALLGDVEFDSNQIDDQVILKSDGFPTYHLAVVVDDYLMKTTHIFRGREWVSSTPKHILLYEYLGWKDSIPAFIHLPLILNTEGGKLSKRHGHASVEYYKKEGYLPEAILNYLSNIVWNNPSGSEIYPLEEFGQAFELDPLKIKITSQGARFDLKKLDWMNGEYIRKMSDQELTKRLQEYLVDHPHKDKIEPVVPLIKERIKKLSEFVLLTDFIFEQPEYDMDVFNKIKIQNQKEVIQKIVKILEDLPKPWPADQFEKSFRDLAAELSTDVGSVFQLLRAIVSGQLVTPPLYECIQLIGEDKVLERVKKVAQEYPNFNQPAEY